MLYEEAIRQLTLDVSEDQGVQPPRAPFTPRRPGGDLVDRVVLGLVRRGKDDGGDLVCRGRLVHVAAHLLEQSAWIGSTRRSEQSTSTDMPPELQR
ncbi:hypothetical protein [Streptomyces sp. NPDC055400]